MAPRRSKIQHRIEWQHPLTQQRYILRVTEIKDYLVAGSTHLELTAPSGVPHPLSQTDYLSHFIDSAELAAAGGAVAFVAAWIERDIKTSQFLKQDLQARPADLFDWATTQQAMNSQPDKRSPRRPNAKARRKSARAPGRQQG